ncbi:MAG TPA: pyridoxal phosphate-dependent aminotransferase [Firmicutes bacterium]|nr:pyridoxal phosphate-dependent aminotransferase [Bacillota bacterium]
MRYDFDTVIDRNRTNSVKWEFMHLFAPDAPQGTLPLWVADMDFPCAEPIIAALHERVDKKIFGYSSPETGEYYRAVCSWYQHRFNWYVNSDDIVFSPGVVPALGYLLEILTEQGDGVIIQPPVYHPFSGKITACGRTIVNNPLLYRDGYYTMDFADLEKKARDPGNKVLLLCSPHNPVGRVWRREELQRLGRICLDNGLYIIADEIHYDLVRRGVAHTPLATLFPGEKHRIITATAPSKTFNLAGLQLSHIIIHDKELRSRWLCYVRDKISYGGPNPLSLAAVQAAYMYGEDWLEAVLAYLDDNVEFLRSYLRRHLPGVILPPPEGTYLAWLDFRAYNLPQDELFARMVRAGVLLENGIKYGREGEGFLRLNFACPRKILATALERMAGTLA